MRVRRNGTHGVKVSFEDGDILDFALGNRKLSRQVLIFSLPAGKRGTCNQSCPGCYALRTERIYPNVRRSRQRNLDTILKDPSKLYQAVLAILDRYNPRVVRIHEGGDFFAPWYAALWDKIAKTCMLRDIAVYSYTKTNYAQSFQHVNIVRSILPDGSLNFGNSTYIQEKQGKYGYPVCPATAGYPVVCGEDCTLCHTHKHVLFYKH